MSNTMSNNEQTLDNGTPNLANPRVLAAFLDGVGILLTPFANACKASNIVRPKVKDEDILNIVAVYRTLQEMRNAVGQDTDWYNDPQHGLIESVIAEGESKRKKLDDKIVQASVQALLDAGMPLDLIPPEFRPKASPADAADAIIEQLRADGVIG